jgi:hypothetical protein
VGYADLDAAKQELGLSANDPGDAFDIARLAAFDAALSRRFDELTGRTWGDHDPEERTFRAPGVSSLLVLDVPVTGPISVETDGTWNGTAWDDGTTVAATYLRLTYGGRAIERTDGGYWTGDVRVTGTWDDEVNGAAPADVVAAVTEAVVAEHRRRTFNARQTTQSFDELDASPPPNPLSGPLWKAAVATHAAKRLVVA